MLSDDSHRTFEKQCQCFSWTDIYLYMVVIFVYICSKYMENLFKKKWFWWVCTFFHIQPSMTTMNWVLKEELIRFVQLLLAELEPEQTLDQRRGESWMNQPCTFTPIIRKDLSTWSNLTQNTDVAPNFLLFDNCANHFPIEEKKKWFQIIIPVKYVSVLITELLSALNIFPIGLF